MRYVRAKLKEKQLDLAYRIYVTDSMFYYGENKRLNVRYKELVYPEQIDNRTGDEVALELIKKLGLKVK